MRSAKAVKLGLGPFLCVLTASVAAQSDTSGAPDLLVEVEINGVVRPEPAVVRDTADRGLLVQTADLRRWGIRTSTLGEETFVPVTHIPGMRARVDFAHQRLVVAAAPSLLPAAELTLADESLRDAIPSMPGLTLGYDLAGSHEYGSSRAAGRLEGGAFAGAWHLSSSWQTEADRTLSGKRLDTSLSRDWPERAVTLRLGDAITSTGDWGRAVRMGGMHWGTDFSMRPDFITFPLPAVRGEAALPSTVDVYVNDMLRARREIAPGPFSARDLPVVTGNGELRLVVRDALGREQTIQQPYFASEQLLRTGLSTYSIDLGAIREDYGLESFRYGRTLAIGNFRQGLTDRLTAELRAEVLKHQQTAGFGIVVAVQPGVLLTTSLARSDGDSLGTLGQVALDVSRGALHTGVRVRAASQHFQQIGIAEHEGFAHAIDAHVGWLCGRAGTLGLVYAERDLRDRPDVRLVSMTYGASLGALGYLGAFASYNVRDHGDSQIGLSLTRPIGDRTSTRLSTYHERRGNGIGVDLSRSLPSAEGAGFHLEAEQGPLARVGAGAAWRGDAVTVGADAARVDGNDRYQAYASGGLLLMGGSLTPVRDLDVSTSFAMVEVPGQSGIAIYHDNHRAAVTDARGVAVITGLRPYEANRLHFDPADLPIDVTVASNGYSVRPYRGGGVRVKFPAMEHGVLVRLVRESGEAVPAGARVSVGSRSFVVAGNGAAYLTGVTGDVTLESTWPGHRCLARIKVPVGVVMPDLSAVMCLEPL